jgi:hypothetical protein
MLQSPRKAFRYLVRGNLSARYGRNPGFSLLTNDLDSLARIDRKQSKELNLLFSITNCINFAERILCKLF